jgi:hypothetical protein
MRRLANRLGRAGVLWGALTLLGACAAPEANPYTQVQAGLGAFTPAQARAVRLAAWPVPRLRPDNARPNNARPGDPEAECVPFARKISGIDLVGDAHSWWALAEGRFDRGARPRPGAVMVFRAQPEMSLGHVAVVTAMLDARTVQVAHRNWDGGLGKGRISLDQKVVDVSPRNDWSSVRVWHEGTRAMGPNAWALAGFIHAAPPRRVLAGL